jgi:hypothetical protein
VSKLKFFLGAAVVIGSFATTSCKKTTTNNTVVKDSVYYSAWIPLSTALQVDNAGDSFYVDEITASAITAKVISQGAIVGYFGYPVSTTDTLIFNEAEFGYNTEVGISPGAIDIQSVVDLTYTGSTGYLFRYVIIPGNVLTTSFNGMTQQQLNKLSFSDVQKAVNAAKQASGNTFTP